MAGTPTTDGSPERLAALDAVRGLAALAVVFSHCLATFPPFSDVYLAPDRPHPAWVTLLAYSPLHLFWGGQEEVLLFFVLSGFVLALPFVAGRGPSYGAFVVRRICRIYLPYAAVVAIAAALMAALAGAPPHGLGDWFYRSWSRPLSWELAIDHALMLGATPLNTVDAPVWSLVHEMRVSLLFPLLVAAVIRLPGLAPYALALGLYAAGGWTMRAPWALAHIPLTLAATLQYAAYFAAGAGLAKHREAIVAWLEARRPLALTGLVITALFLFNVRWQLPGLPRGQELLAGVGACMLLMLALGWPRARAFLERAPWQWLGRISYSLYLTHVVVLLAMAHTLGRVLPMPLVIAAVPIVALVVAHVAHRLIEVPAIALGRHLTTRPRPEDGGAQVVAEQGPG